MPPTRPPFVSAVCATLSGAGYAAHPVGGCVRDLLLGRTPVDWDIATAASPQVVTALFPRTHPTGLRHGTVTVVTDGGPLEVTTFRREGGYSDGRRPDTVSFDATLTQDLARRDLTINAMALEAWGAVVDPFGGQCDLANRLLRCVGDPAARFTEDGLRMLRTVRFSAQLDFAVEPATLTALHTCAPRMALVSAERVGAELGKLLLSPLPQRGNLLFSTQLLAPWWGTHPCGDLSPLAALPGEPLLRWAGLCALLGQDPGKLLPKLRLDRVTVRACADGWLLFRAGVPKDSRAWRCGLAQLGTRACRAAAAMGAVTAIAPGGLADLDEVLAESPCVTVTGLALSGRDIAALGLVGREVGCAQRCLLDHVLAVPEHNNRAALLDLLKTWMG